MPFAWKVSWKDLPGGSKMVKLTRTEQGLTRRTSRTVSYRLPPGETVPSLGYQFERAWKRANESPAKRKAREDRDAARWKAFEHRQAEISVASRPWRLVSRTGCAVMVVAAAVIVGGFVTALLPGPCWKGASVYCGKYHPHAALGWSLMFGGLALLLVGWAVTHAPVRRRDAADAREAERRNEEDRRTRRDAMSQLLAEYREQGYAAEAAEALASKRLRDERPEQRVWRQTDIAAERWETMRQKDAAAAALMKEQKAAELQHRVDVGELACCPRCEEYAPVSQRVILAHRVGSPPAPCEGEGTVLGDL